MSQITYEEICYDYWDPELFNGTLPDEHIFNQKEGQLVVKNLAANIRNYFRGNSTDAPPQFIELLSKGSIENRYKLNSTVKHLAGVNFREEIGKTLFLQNSFIPYDLELVLVEQLFETCIEVENPTLSATVTDIVYVYNALIHNERFIITNEHQKDPLRQLVFRELGGKPINLAEKEALSLRVNL